MRAFAEKNGKLEYYDKHISSAKLGHLCYHVRKIWRIKDEDERRMICSTFKREYTKTEVDRSSVVYKYYRKEILIGKLCTTFGNIYISEWFCNVVRRVKYVK